MLNPLLSYLICIPMVILLLAFPFAKSGRFVADQPASSAVWYRMTLFSLAIIVSNNAIIPTIYFLFHEKRLTANILVLIAADTMAWFLMQIVLKSAFSSSQAIRKGAELDPGPSGEPVPFPARIHQGLRAGAA